MQSLSRNPCLQQWDQAISFKNEWSDSEVLAKEQIVRQAETAAAPYAHGMIADKGFALAVSYECLVAICARQEVNDRHRIWLQDMQRKLNLSSDDMLRLCTRLYLDTGLRSIEESQSNQATQKDAKLSLHQSQVNLAQLNLLPEARIASACHEFLESCESTKLPDEASMEIRVAILSLVAHAVRADNTVDDREKAFQDQVARELGVTEEGLKRYPYLLKSATPHELCSTIKKWSMSNAKPAVLFSTASFLLRALGSDGVMEIREEKFKTQLMQQLNVDGNQYARLVLRLRAA